VGGVTGSHKLSALPRTLIIAQNLPVPFDRRVWLECKALTAAGHDITAASYVDSGDRAAYAKSIVELLDDGDRREVMGRAGCRRIEDELVWSRQPEAYVGAYKNAVGRHMVRG
jgi:hypothetical protein